MRRVLITMLLALLPAVAQAQQTPPQQQSQRRPPTAAERAAYAARRDSLEREIVQKFILSLTRELKLDAEQRTQTERVLAESGERRKEMARAADELRGRMFRALRESSTSDADFLRLLGEAEVLTVREHNLWQRTQDELARVYSPRQRVHFLLAWTRFQESLREILSDHRSRGGPKNH